LQELQKINSIKFVH